MARANTQAFLRSISCACSIPAFLSSGSTRVVMCPSFSSFMLPSAYIVYIGYAVHCTQSVLFVNRRGRLFFAFQWKACTMWTMADRDYEFEKPTKTVRLEPDERARLAALMKIVLGRNKLAKPGPLMKDLMGLTNNFNLTKKERALVGEGLQVFAPAPPNGHSAELVDEVGETKPATQAEVDAAHSTKAPGRKGGKKGGK